jgi:hypothetical protein
MTMGRDHALDNHLLDLLKAERQRDLLRSPRGRGAQGWAPHWGIHLSRPVAVHRGRHLQWRLRPPAVVLEVRATPDFDS